MDVQSYATGARQIDTCKRRKAEASDTCLRLVVSLGDKLRRVGLANQSDFDATFNSD